MKVLMINGSPHVKGNTKVALEEMVKIFHEEGIETEILDIGNKDIRGCVACYTCMQKGKCVFDDIVNESAAKFEACDGLVIASSCLLCIRKCNIDRLSGSSVLQYTF